MTDGGFGSRYGAGTQTEHADPPIYTGGGGFGARYIGGPTHESGGGHSGLLGVLAQTGKDLYHAAVNTPAGVYYLGKGLATHPLRTVQQVGKSTLQDFEHPLRHPGNTLLDVLGLASAGAGTVARIGAVSKALEEGAAAGDVAKAALRLPQPGPRVLSHDGVNVEATYSRSPLTRVAQKGVDKLIEAKAPGLNARRVGSQLGKQERVIGGIERGGASALVAAGRGLSREQQTALRVVAEGVPIDERVATHEADLAGASGLQTRRLRAKIDALHGARQYLDTSTVRPRIAADQPKLNAIYQQVKHVANDREELLTKIGELTPKSIEERLHSPGRVFKGARFETPTLKAALQDAQPDALLGHAVETADGGHGTLLKLEGGTGTVRFHGKNGGVFSNDLPVSALRLASGGRLVGAEEFRGGDVYISHGPDQGFKATLQRTPQIGANRSIAQPAPLKSTTHALTGAAIHQGSFGDKTTELVGRSALEATKLGALLRLREAIKPAVKAVPTSKHDILVRLDELHRGEALPGVAKELRDKVELGAKLTPDEQRQIAGAFEQLRSRIFPTTSAAPLSPEGVAELERLHGENKIGFVDRRLLGGLDKPQPQLEQFIGARGAKTFDAVNNASRAAILYLKPAYAIPNLLGNVALNVVQQGWAAPRELAASWRLSHNPELAARVDEIMGEGFARSLAGESGIGTRAIQAAANFWGRGVDVPFRRASFLYEARRVGFKTPERLHALLTDESKRATLLEVARRANAEIIDYGALSPIERAVIARVVFFYPWVRGSSVYAAHFVAEHPIEAAMAGEVGRLGYERTQSDLGPLPSYLEGVIPVGSHNGNPVVVNPSSAAIFQTPAQVAAGLVGLFQGNPKEISQLTNFTTPAVNLGADLLTRTDVTSGLPIKGNAANAAYTALAKNLPQTTLIRNVAQAMHGEGKNRLYPPSVKSALLQYLLGGVANPRELNLPVARRQASSGR